MKKSKNTIIAFRTTAEIKDKLQEESEKIGISLSRYITMIIKLSEKTEALVKIEKIISQYE